MLGRLEWLLTLLTTLLALFGVGCSQLTEGQVALQHQRMADFSEFAQDNGLSMVMAANVALDGSFEHRQVFKWSPITGDITAVFFNQQTASMLLDLLGNTNTTGSSGARRDQTVVAGVQSRSNMDGLADGASYGNTSHSKGDQGKFCPVRAGGS